MAMTETFAATAAQTIPVFALAGIIELRGMKRPYQGETRNDVGFIAYAVACVLWFVIILLDFDAELTCLKYLRGLPVARSADASVQRAMLISLAAVAVVPALGWILTPAVRRYELLI